MNAFLRDGRVFVITTDEAFASAFHVAVGDRATRFTPADIAQLDLSGMNLLDDGGFARGVEGWVFDGTGAVRFGVNLADEWRLRDGAVAFLQTEPQPERFSLKPKGLDGTTRLPVVGGARLRVRGLSACHRCIADLAVAFFAADGRALPVRHEELPVAAGGTSRDAYHAIDAAMVAPAQATHAELAITYVKPHDARPDYASFIFLAGFSVTLPELGMDAARHFRPYASVLGAVDAENAPKLFAAAIDVAHLTASRCDVEVRDASGALAAVPLRFADVLIPPRATLAQTGADSFELVTPFPFPHSLFIDGRRVADHLVANTERGLRIRLCADLLDGEHHRVAIRDGSGCVGVCETEALLPARQTAWPALQEHDGPTPPAQLAPNAGQRYRSLLAHAKRHATGRSDGPVAAGGVPSLAAVTHAHDVLAKGFAHNTLFSPLAFPRHEAPRVSIVVPVHDKFEVTYFCLCALLFAYTEVSFEVIVVDDGSTDRTVTLPTLAAGVTYLRNERALGFVHSCNKGAAAARGGFILLLNNDTEPAFRWLDELVDAFALFDGVGIAGAKLLHPDGRLQDAGGIIWRNGNPWNYGRDANPDDPRFCYTRQVDYVPGAALMIPAAVWREVGGFSTAFAPAYFEDTDLAFAVREAGYRTLLVATAIVYHFEGVTSGTDVARGAKRHQEVNRPVFKRKWGPAFRAFAVEGDRPDLEKDRGVIGRALFLDYQTPRPDVDAGSYAARQEMRLVQRLGYKITFFPMNGVHLPQYFAAMQREGVEMLHAPFFATAADVLARRGREFNLVYITRYYVAREVIELVRLHAPQAKVLFCNADLHFLRQLRSALHSGDAVAAAQALDVRDLELAVMREVDLTLSYTEVERAVILSHNGGDSRVMRLPWVETPRADGPPLVERDGIAFLGGFNHHPNVEAVAFFASLVMPALGRHAPTLVFRIYGSNMPAHLAALAAPTVEPQGYVADVGAVFDSCRVFVAPLLSGAGIKGKVLAALAHGVPCVLSPLAAEGIGLRHGDDCLIAETPEQWVAAILALTRDDDLWHRIARRGRALIGESYSVEKGLAAMRGIIEAVGLQTA